MKVCPVCGAELLKNISTEKVDDNEFVNYICGACGEKSSSKILKKNDSPVKEKKGKIYAGNVGARVFNDNKDSIVLLSSCPENNAISYGSGFIVSSSGYVITNAHVVTNVNKPSQNLSFDLNENVEGEFVTNDKDTLEIVNVDLDKDLALLRFEQEKPYKAVTLGDYIRLETGDNVYAIGNSKGDGLSITSGIVSDKNRSLKGQNYILTDTVVNPGNSGCPLFDCNGKVVGVIVLSRKDAVGMNCAIPINQVVEFIKNTEKKEEIRVL